MTTWNTVALVRWTFIWNVLPLLFQPSCMLLITSLPKSQCLNILVAATKCTEFSVHKLSLPLLPFLPHPFAMQSWGKLKFSMLPLWKHYQGFSRQRFPNVKNGILHVSYLEIRDPIVLGNMEWCVSYSWEYESLFFLEAILNSGYFIWENSYNGFLKKIFNMQE